MSRRSGEDAAVREGRARPSSTGLRGNHRSQVPEVPTGGPGPTPALTCSHFLRPPRGTAHPAPSTTTETSTSKRVIYLHTENKTSARGPRAGRVRQASRTNPHSPGRRGEVYRLQLSHPHPPYPLLKNNSPLPPLKPTQSKEWDRPREMPGKDKQLLSVKMAAGSSIPVTD